MAGRESPLDEVKSAVNSLSSMQKLTDGKFSGDLPRDVSNAYGKFLVKGDKLLRTLDQRLQQFAQDKKILKVLADGG